MSEPVEYRLAELERRMWNLLRLGVIAAVDCPAARVKVQSGDLVTGWIPWLTRRAAQDADWWAPEPGEQVLLLSPCGDPAQAVALPALYQSAYPAPESSPDKRRIEFSDGTSVEYDRAAHLLSIDCVGDVAISVVGDADVQIDGRCSLASQKLTITSSENAVIETPTLEVNGDISVNGNINATGNIVDGGTNTNHHTHP